MPILDIQQREAERGRIRFGNTKVSEKTGKEIPNRLQQPMFTTDDSVLASALAKAVNATVEPWTGDDNQWQVMLPNDFPILIEVQPEPFDAWWERWANAGCIRRCDGFMDTITGKECDCDKEASDGRACKATTRIRVMTPHTGDAKLRIESKSLIFAGKVAEMLKHATGEKTGEVVDGLLSVEQVQTKKGLIPVPHIKLNKPGAAPPGSDDAHASDVQVESSGGTAPPPEDSLASEVITQADIRKMMAESNKRNIPEDVLKALVHANAGVTSRKLIPAAKFAAVMDAIGMFEGEK